MERLHRFRAVPIFTAREAQEAGMYPALLAYYIRKQQVERVARGVYRIPQAESRMDFQWEDLMVAVASIPRGVVCLISALSYYGLTDEVPREHWIAVPHSTTAPVRPEVRVIRMRNTILGATTVELAGRSVKIFDRERTVVDAFRYLGKETAIKALRAYLSSPKIVRPDTAKLLAYSRELRVSIESYILALTT